MENKEKSEIAPGVVLQQTTPLPCWLFFHFQHKKFFCWLSTLLKDRPITALTANYCSGNQQSRLSGRIEKIVYKRTLLML